jgi:transposase-like protein
MRQFLAIDGTFLKARFVQTLLLAVGVDANSQITLLAWGVVESENRSSWEWFLCHLRRAIPEVYSEGMILISDRDKGLLEAEEVLGTLVIRAYCCWHLKENFTEKFGCGLVSAFWKVARSRIAILFEVTLDEIAKVKPAAA